MRAEERERPRLPDPGELAWLGVVPCAVIVLVAIVVLGPPLGRIVFPPSDITFWRAFDDPAIRPDPEPTEHMRYLLSLTAPLLLSAFVLAGRRFVRPLRPATIAALVAGTQIAGLAFVAVCLVVQYSTVFEAGFSPTEHVVFFKPATLVAAAVIAAATIVALARDRVRLSLGRLLRETPARRVAGTAVALLAIAIWILPAVNFEHTIGGAHESILEHIPLWLDETFAVLNGRYPLVDYAAQYGSLWPYPIAGAMTLVGASVGTYTVAMATIGATAMLAMFATLRRVARGTLAGLLLFLPLLATGFFAMAGPLDNRYAIVNLFSTFPLRYAGPLLLLWLVARHLDGATPRRPAWLFLAAGLVVLNNADFGIPALGATVAALLWARPPSRARLPRLAAEAAVGLLAAGALVSALTLATAGDLPHFALLVRLSRLYALAGYGMVPMIPTIGLSTIIYLTYVAAIGVATVRAATAAPDRLTTGLLAWSGIFGLGAASYYMGRSYPEVLTNEFLAWAISLTLLVLVVVRAIAARPSRRPTLAEVACLFGFGLLVCSLAQTPTPWSQVSRLRTDELPLLARPTGQPFIAAHSRPGEAVAILTPLGHRAAYNLGIVDVTPYSGPISMPSVDQLDETLVRLRAAHGRSVFLSVPEAWPGLVEGIESRGYREVAREPYGMAQYARPG